MNASQIRTETLGKLAITEVRHYQTFSPNWDSYSAQPFDPLTIDLACTFVEHVVSYAIQQDLSIDEIMPGPCPDGRVVIEVLRIGRHLHATFSSDTNEVEWYRYQLDGQGAREYNIPYSAVREEVKWIFK